MQQDYLPKAEKMNTVISFVDDDLLPLVKQEIDAELLERHRLSLQKEKDRIHNLEEAKKKAKEAADEAERRRREAQLKRREERRVKRITENVTTKIITQFANRRDITSLPLMDIDELSIKGESINCLGGQLGEILFVISEIFKNVIEPEKPDADIKKIIKEFLKEFLNQGFAGIIPVKPAEGQPPDNKQNNQQPPASVVLPNVINNDNFILELRYLESPKYDWENIPEEKRNDFANFIKDDRRYISKSVHKLIELGIIKKEFLDTFNEVIAEIYFQGPVEPEKIEPDPSKAEDAAYQEEIKKKQEEAEKKAQEENAFNEKIKKKIKISLIKPEVFKKKRDNIGAFITVEPNPFEKGLVQEIEEIPISRRETDKKNEEENKEENAQQEGENQEANSPEGGNAEEKKE
jgi:predicted transcriptional regulator